MPLDGDRFLDRRCPWNECHFEFKVLFENIIYGRSDVSSLDQVVRGWRSGGGEQIRAEYQQALQTSS